MNSSSQSHTIARSSGLEGYNAPVVPRAAEDDLALGCECANPALQIDGWRQEAAGLQEVN